MLAERGGGATGSARSRWATLGSALPGGGDTGVQGAWEEEGKEGSASTGGRGRRCRRKSKNRHTRVRSASDKLEG